MIGIINLVIVIIGVIFTMLVIVPLINWVRRETMLILLWYPDEPSLSGKFGCFVALGIITLALCVGPEHHVISNVGAVLLIAPHIERIMVYMDEVIHDLLNRKSGK